MSEHSNGSLIGLGDVLRSDKNRLIGIRAISIILRKLLKQWVLGKFSPVGFRTQIVPDEEQ